MDEKKSIFLSVTFWGTVVTFVSPLLVKYGIKFDDATTAQAAQALCGLAGAIITIYGRSRASKAVSITGK